MRDRALNAATAAVSAPSNPAVEEVSFRVLLDRALEEPELRWAQDLRWASEDSVWVAAGRSGVFEVSLAGNRELRRVTAGGEAPDGLFVAASGGVVAAVRPFGDIGWLGVDTGVSWAHPMATIVDFDLWRGEAIFLGARRDELGQWAPEEGVLWAGTLGANLDDLAPRMYSASGTMADEVAFCGILEIGAVRFFPDCRYAVVPGFQPGAYLYDRSGHLLRAWDTESLGFYDRCTLDGPGSQPLHRDPVARRSWVHQRIVLDELIDWYGWPGLVLRQPEQRGTSWRLVVLGEVGASQRVELPVKTRSVGSHLRADLRGRRLALLISEFGPEEPPAAPPRLVVLEVSRGSTGPRVESR